MITVFEVERLKQEALSFWLEGRMLEAALGIEQALTVAKRHDLRNDLPNLLWLSSSFWKSADEPGKALDALLTLRESYQDVIDVDLEAAIQSSTFAILYSENPDLESLEERVRVLEDLSKSNGDSCRGEVLAFRNAIYSGRGMWAQALAEKEAQWTNRDTAGACYDCQLSDLVNDSIDAGDGDKAGFWCEQLKDKNPRSASCMVRKLSAEIDFALAYASINEAIAISKELYERYGAHDFARTSVSNLRIRCLLLDITMGDPSHPLHPARQILLRHRKACKTHAEKFTRGLLICDYRLACLRYAAGCAPREDLFRNEIEARDISGGLGPTETAKRTQKMQTALDRTKAIAAWLDSAFRCSWRRKEIDSRTSKVAAIKRLASE
jgi:hypothetical protein